MQKKLGNLDLLEHDDINLQNAKEKEPEKGDKFLQDLKFKSFFLFLLYLSIALFMSFYFLYSINSTTNDLQIFLSTGETFLLTSSYEIAILTAAKEKKIDTSHYTNNLF